MEQRFDSVDKRFDEQDKKISDIYDAIDGLAKLITEYHQEMVMLTRQVDRMKEAIKQIAQETGVKLKFEL